MRMDVARQIFKKCFPGQDAEGLDLDDMIKFVDDLGNTMFHRGKILSLSDLLHFVTDEKSVYYFYFVPVNFQGETAFYALLQNYKKKSEKVDGKKEAEALFDFILLLIFWTHIYDKGDTLIVKKSYTNVTLLEYLLQNDLWQIITKCKWRATENTLLALSELGSADKARMCLAHTFEFKQVMERLATQLEIIERYNGESKTCVGNRLTACWRRPFLAPNVPTFECTVWKHETTNNFLYSVAAFYLAFLSSIVPESIDEALLGSLTDPDVEEVIWENIVRINARLEKNVHPFFTVFTFVGDTQPQDVLASEVFKRLCRTFPRNGKMIFLFTEEVSPDVDFSTLALPFRMKTSILHDVKNIAQSSPIDTARAMESFQRTVRRPQQQQQEEDGGNLSFDKDVIPMLLRLRANDPKYLTHLCLKRSSALLAKAGWNRKVRRFAHIYRDKGLGGLRKLSYRELDEVFKNFI